MATLWYGDVDWQQTRGFELPMLSVPLPMEAVWKATTTFAVSSSRPDDPHHDYSTNNDNDDDDKTLATTISTIEMEKRLKQLKKHIVSRLWEEYAIEVPIFVWKKPYMLGFRISFGRHVTLEDIELLGDAVLDILEKGISL